MGKANEQFFGTLTDDVTMESLAHEIAYYKSMLAEAERTIHSPRSCLTPEMLRQRLTECERQMDRLQRSGMQTTTFTYRAANG